MLGLEFYIGPPREPENLNKNEFNSEKDDNVMPRIWSLGALPGQRILENCLKETDQFGENEPLNRAYEVLADDGFFDPDAIRRVAIAFRALEISPLCVDAYLELCDFVHLELYEEEQIVRLAIDAAERSIHPDLLISDRGNFWENLETRSYVRARSRLAYIYKSKYDMESAVREYWDIIELDNGDHIGARYPLLVCLLNINDQEGVDRLFSQFRDDISAHMLYTRALIEYERQCGRDEGISLGAHRLAKQAYKANMHIPQLLSEYDGFQYQIEEERYSTGSVEEALVYSDYFGWKWYSTAGAVNWLLRANKLPEVNDTNEDENDQISESPALYSAPVRYNELADLADDTALSAERLPARQVDVMELAAAAGGGATELDETVTGQVWFARHWLDQRGLDAAQCSVIVVKGESMEPTLPDSCSILVARQRKRRKDGKLFVLLTADGLVVKRLSKAPNESWQLQSDHPAWPPVAWSAEVTIIGQVVWMARRL